MGGTSVEVRIRADSERGAAGIKWAPTQRTDRTRYGPSVVKKAIKIHFSTIITSETEMRCDEREK